MFTIITKSEKETENTAYELAKENKIKFGDTVALYGDLGAGKTSFTRGLVSFFSPLSRVTDPPFALVNEYKINNSDKILHFDMHKINSKDDLLSTGFYDCYDNINEKITIIEWFDNIDEFFDGNTVNVGIVKLGGNERKIIFERPDDYLIC